MAKPISLVKKRMITEEERQEQTIQRLKQQLAESNEALEKSLVILNELHQSGILEAAESMLKAKAKIAEIALGQISRKEVTNLINNGMAAAGALTNIDPAQTSKLMNGLTSGIQEANASTGGAKKIGLFTLMKSLKDPDVNRALGFGLNFLKGLGRGLQDKDEPNA
ncbi:hypothetical protein DCC85_16380 [Paenibacillus sp. CAA11]|uniref:DUF1641 domain-containing protein n=1 Tax=Paenibacillus sp. CAA11 TaxID=1532905 RepID=UPI000D3B855B|nr:DUF1641 domain-containing protein [Paenibacillus sp. CAA11]AWB45616.1 hypothetical protein DCC85_16380 [Paenibacillus sp. CAA11]